MLESGDPTPKQRAVVDRVEDGRLAVLLVGEEEREVIVPVKGLPEDAAEGVWLWIRLAGDRVVEAAVDQNETNQVRSRVAEKLERLRRRGPKLR